MTGRRLSWIVMAVVLLTALVLGSGSTGPRTTEQQILSIERTIKCPVCRSQSVETSDAQVSATIRTYIGLQVRGGKTPEEIRDSLALTYGDGVLLNPPASGLGSLVFVIPVAALIIAVAGLFFVFRRGRGEAAAELTDEDRQLVDDARREEGLLTGGTGPADRP